MGDLEMTTFTRFTVRNVTINNAQTAIFGIWNWGKRRRVGPLSCTS